MKVSKRSFLGSIVVFATGALIPKVRSELPVPPVPPAAPPKLRPHPGLVNYYGYENLMSDRDFEVAMSRHRGR